MGQDTSGCSGCLGTGCGAYIFLSCSIFIISLGIFLFIFWFSDNAGTVKNATYADIVTAQFAVQGGGSSVDSTLLEKKILQHDFGFDIEQGFYDAALSKNNIVSNIKISEYNNSQIQLDQVIVSLRLKGKSSSGAITHVNVEIPFFVRPKSFREHRLPTLIGVGDIKTSCLGYSETFVLKNYDSKGTYSFAGEGLDLLLSFYMSNDKILEKLTEIIIKRAEQRKYQ